MNHEIKLAAALSADEDLVEMFKENYTADELADLLMEKNADWRQAAAGLVNKAGPAIRRAAQYVSGVGTPGGPTHRQLGLAGMGIGAGLGAARHMLKSKDPRTGQRQGSLLGSMAGGAAMGGLGGLAAPTIGKSILDSKNKTFQSAMRGNFGAKPVGSAPGTNPGSVGNWSGMPAATAGG